MFRKITIDFIFVRVNHKSVYFLLKICETMLQKNTLLFAFLLFTLSFFCQENQIIPETLSTEIEKLSDNNEKESIYIQTNKGIYETGEDLWFKTYILNNRTLAPSFKSQILYLQLSSEKDSKIVWQEKYIIKSGFANGHVYLKDSLKPGIYTIEAFTSNSVLRNDREYKSLRKIQIISSISNEKEIKKDSLINSKDAHIDFFPESGNLISEIENVVAFKATDKNGLPIDFNGFLYENDKKIKEIKSYYDGMGKFSIIPNKNNTYKIVLEGDFIKNTFELPEIKERGKTFKLYSKNDDFLRFIVSQTKGLQEEPIYLRIQSKGKVYGIAKGFIKEKLVIKIPIKDLPSGIAEVTLFDKNLGPIAERLVFLHQDKKLRISTTLEKTRFFTKEEVSFKIKVTDENENPVSTHLGISVYDKIYKNPLDVKNILTHYQLSTDLKGKIFNPHHYFDDKNEKRIQALDLLLLTQGWRKYVWNQEELKKNSFTKAPFLNDTIFGKVLFLDEKNKEKNNLTQYFVMGIRPDSLNTKEIITLDDNNNFQLPPAVLEKSSGGFLYLQLVPVQYKIRHVVQPFDSHFNKIDKFKENTVEVYPFIKLKNEEIPEVKPFRVANKYKLDEVIVTTKKKKVYRDKYIGSLDSLANLSGNFDYVCQFNILNCKNHDYYKKPVEGEIYGVWVGDQVVQEKYTFIKKNYSEEELLRMFQIGSIKGHYKNKVFYNPIYTKEEQEYSFPDFRNTLYWNPEVITDKNGEASITFHCSDLDANFIGIIEGVGVNGLLGNHSFEFKVITRK